MEENEWRKKSHSNPNKKTEMQQIDEENAYWFRHALQYIYTVNPRCHEYFMLIDGSDEIGYFLWKFQSRALLT